jgi:hypothetical protein
MCNNQLYRRRAIKPGCRAIFLLLLGAMAGPVRAQHVRDTTAAIRDFDDVMAFVVQPYVYYSSTMSMMTGPMRNGGDSVVRLHGKFYKYGDDMYYGSEAEELFVQDSLMIRIDHHRKAIDLRRIDMSTKKNIDLLPLKRSDVQKLFRNRYLIAEMPRGGDTAIISIRSQPGGLTAQWQSAEMRVEYKKESHLPLIMEVRMQIRQPGTDQVKAVLTRQGFDIGGMVDSLNGTPVFVVNETVAVRFDEMATSKEQAAHMPLWTEKVAYSPAARQFSGVGVCAGYTITKTF